MNLPEFEVGYQLGVKRGESGLLNFMFVDSSLIRCVPYFIHVSDVSQRQ